MTTGETIREERDALGLRQQIDLLEANARVLENQGLHLDAERIYREILRLSPANRRALHFLAVRHLSAGNLDEAQKFIERGVAVEPDNNLWHQHMGILLRSRGFLDGSLRAFDRTLQLDPALGTVWVQRGDVLQALGRHEEAVASYYYAEMLLGNLEAAAARAPRKTSLVVRRAGQTLRHARLQQINDTLAPILERYPSEALARVKNTLLTAVNGVPGNNEERAQQPSLFYLPGLAARPFFDRSNFPLLRGLEKRRDDISDEIRQLAEAAFAQPDSFPDLWESGNEPEKRSRWHLYRMGLRQDEAAARWPRTAALVETLSLARLPGLLPEVRFFGMKPNTHIDLEYGFSNFTPTVLFPLLAPKGCGIKVGAEAQPLRPGKSLVFDSSFKHECWNRGASSCVMLMFESWHPDLTEAERAYLSAAQEGCQRFHESHVFRDPGETRTFADGDAV